MCVIRSQRARRPPRPQLSSSNFQEDVIRASLVRMRRMRRRMRVANIFRVRHARCRRTVIITSRRRRRRPVPHLPPRRRGGVTHGRARRRRRRARARTRALIVDRRSTTTLVDRRSSSSIVVVDRRRRRRRRRRVTPTGCRSSVDTKPTKKVDPHVLSTAVPTSCACASG